MKKIANKMNNDETTKKDEIDVVRNLIIDKYGDLKKLAEEMGISQSQLSNHLKKPSSKFLSKLKKHGIDIGKIGAHSVKIVNNGSAVSVSYFEKIIEEKNGIINELKDIIKILREERTTSKK